MNLVLLTTYAAQLAAIAEAAAVNAAESKLASAAGKARKDTLASTIRQYAKDTAGDGVATDEASTALRLVLQAADFKPGTVKGYGASFRGYRAMIADGKPETEIDAANTAKAQDYVASEEVKAMKAQRERVKVGTKDWTLAQVTALADAIEATNAEAKADATPTEAETADVEQEAAAA